MLPKPRKNSARFLSMILIQYTNIINGIEIFLPFCFSQQERLFNLFHHILQIHFSSVVGQCVKACIFQLNFALLLGFWIMKNIFDRIEAVGLIESVLIKCRLHEGDNVEF